MDKKQGKMNPQIIHSYSYRSAIITKSPIKRTTIPFVQQIFSDDKILQSIKVQGQTAQINMQKNKPQKEIRDPNLQKKQEKVNLNQKKQKKQQAKQIYKRPNMSVSITRKQIQKTAEINYKRSLTVQSGQMLHKLCSTRKSNQKLNKTDYHTQNSSQLHVKPQKKILNDQIYQHFKQMLDQFNKAKNRIEDKNEIHLNKVYKTNYKKPNFYQYQQFFRQRYQAKFTKESTFLFTKNQNAFKGKNQEKANKEYASKPSNISNKNNESNLYISTTRKRNKQQKVYVHVDFESGLIPLNPQCSIQKKIKLFPTYLQVKSRSMKKAEREQVKKKMSYFTQTDRQRRAITQMQKQHQKLSPWITNQLDNPIF